MSASLHKKRSKTSASSLGRSSQSHTQSAGGGAVDGLGVGGSAVGPSFFYEDEVFKVNKNGDVEFGMVTENWDMYSTDEDDDEDDYDGKVPHGSVAVTWLPKSKDEVLAETKVKLSDRSLMPGDVVRRLIAGKDTQRGYCRSVKVCADVQLLGSKKVILSVPATSLAPVQKLQSEIAVYMDNWIGVVREAKYKITLKFADGSQCTTDSEVLIDTFEELRNSTEYSNSEVFYPGQKLRGRMRYLKNAEFSFMSEELKRAKEKKVVTAIVQDVKPMSVNVQWQWQTPSASTKEMSAEQSLKPPAETLTGEDINRIQCLNLFESCTVQLCDISYYSPTPEDKVLNKNDWKRKVATMMASCPEKSLKSVAGAEDKESLGLCNGETVEEDDDAFQSCDENLESWANKNIQGDKDKEKSSKPNSKKVMPKVSTRSLRKKKLKKAVKAPSLPKLENENVSVVETVHTQSLVDVVWQDGTYEEAMRSVDLYPIHHLDDHEFFPGDFVVNAETNDFKKYGVIQRMDHCGRVALVKWFETYSFNGEQKPTQLEEMEMSVYDIKDHPDFRFRPGTIVIRVANIGEQQCPAGQILDNYPDGQVRVWWANGTVTSCWPQDLFRLGEYDSDDEIWDDNEADTDAEGEGKDQKKEDEEDEGANSDSSWETDNEDDPTNDAEGEGGAADRYQNIGQLIERIQKTLVNTREAIVASSSVSVTEEPPAPVTPEQKSAGPTGTPGTPVAKLGNFDERGLTKKLLAIYKDCQYLDKIMGTKYFDIEDLKKWRNSNEKDTSIKSKSRRILEQISRLFNVPKSETSLVPEVKVPESKPTPPTSPVADITVVTVGAGGSGTPTEQGDPGMILYDLCSIILTKLVDAHNEYEKRFGSFKLEQEGKVVSGAEDAKEEEVKGGENVPLPAETEDTNGESKVSGVLTSILAFIRPSDSGSEQIPKDLASTGASSKFSIVEKVPDTHRYRLTSFMPHNQRQFIKTVQREVAFLRESLPDGIFVKGFEDRMDLYSVMIEGPLKTPYEDGLFMFDIQLPPQYPTVPPLVHYIAFCTDRLNPNLYEEGKVCVSLLGTWNGKGTEVWGAASSLLQLLVSFQGLILGPEPYYNEAGYEKQKGTQQGAENSRMYNENVLIKLTQSMSRMIANPAAAWEKESALYIKEHGPRMVARYQAWLELSEAEQNDPSIELPPFPLLPVSKGFKITLTKSIASFAKLLPSIQLQ